MSEAQHQSPQEGHTGPIKKPKQLLATVFFAFIIPILIIVALVVYVSTGFKPSGAEKGDGASLSGMSQDARERGLAERLARVGVLEIQEAGGGAAKTGKEIYDSLCMACHTAGISGAPKHGDKAAWAPRVAQGYDTLVQHALKGLNAMPPKGGATNLSDFEIARAVVYMANDAGASFPEPTAPADSAAAPAAQ